MKFLDPKSSSMAAPRFATPVLRGKAPVVVVATALSQKLCSRRRIVRAATPVTGSSAEAAQGTSGTGKVAELVDGPTVVITGASQGVGRAASQRFAKEGYNVVLAARSQSNLQKAADLSRVALQSGREVLAVECDITSEDSVGKLRDVVKARFRDVRVLVCNAGVCMTGNFLAHSAEDFQAQLNVNFLGHVSTVQAFLPLLAEQGVANGVKPTVCFVNSFGARVPLPNMTAYCAAKYALQGFADSLRLESPDVHIATVHPGVIRSDFRSRAAWRGKAGERGKNNIDNLLDGKTPATNLVTQSVEEVAEAVFSAVKRQNNETVVGPAFQAMLSGFGLAKAFGFA
eukprot:CAMPEP_0197681770 /NCGR_PEP_ID=MMETSP1338-20131121/95440_1 /TAXON_ID=43686 ORGANISM="Pelagodinium beii, Strain RCC1491" /NCGR_SAMPLE_ID=MMETSP1338 /ASSEMBLY_ACC=CAM_ASM_000754 /LENGTH=342 /DNA_ID=CAMNT_0043263151 /DNA_START=1 /DNA_END=1029 /DNA_ORIENTATION=-